MSKNKTMSNQLPDDVIEQTVRAIQHRKFIEPFSLPQNEIITNYIFYSVGNFNITGWIVTGSHPNIPGHLANNNITAYQYYNPYLQMDIGYEDSGYSAYVLTVHYALYGTIYAEIAIVYTLNNEQRWYLGQLDSDNIVSLIHYPAHEKYENIPQADRCPICNGRGYKYSTKRISAELYSNERNIVGQSIAFIDCPSCSANNPLTPDKKCG